jgi:glycosyltransferase involved in cell wall biosynthesis
MNECKLSIITVNLNDAKGLKVTASSVISQTYTDYELIVIDGGSSDGSKDVIMEVAGNLSYWISEPDKGTYHAMNKGIQVAKGEYCLFLNSWDYLVDNNVLGKIFSNTISADIVSGDVLKLRTNRKFRRVSSPETISLHRLCIHSLPHKATIIRRSIFDETGFYNENYKIASDWEFFLKALVIYEKSYAHINVDISYFRIGGISSRKESIELAKTESYDCLKRNFPKLVDDLMEYRYFYNSNFGQIVLILKRNKRLYRFIDNLFGILLSAKKTVIGK